MRARARAGCVYVRARALACAFARVALLIQRPTRIRHIVYTLSGPTIFLTLSHKRYDFWGEKKVTKYKILFSIKCVFRFSVQPLSITFLILRIIQRDIVINVYRSSRKVPVIVVGF